MYRRIPALKYSLENSPIVMNNSYFILRLYLGLSNKNVLKINKVKYINDSKATNVNATYFALESMTSPTVWIVGGIDKGNDYSVLYPFVNEKVKAIICLGKQNDKLFKNFQSKSQCTVHVAFSSNESIFWSTTNKYLHIPCH